MKDQGQIVREEMRKLISKSCVATMPVHEEYYAFHKALLKFFFSSVDVAIDYEKQVISLWTSKTTKRSGNKLYDMNDAVVITIAYTDLEETLKGCLENGKNSSRFYKTLLFHYNHIDREMRTGVISA